MSQSNGTSGPTVREQLRETRARVKLLQAKGQLALLERRQRLLESTYASDWISGYSDLLDRLRTEDGRMLTAISIASDRQYGANWPFWRTWQEHALLRGASRVLCTTNVQAQGALSGLTSFVIGEGYAWKARPKHDDAPPGLVEAVQDVIADFGKRNEWAEMEQELFRRSRRDGEFFARAFVQDDGTTLIRTVEPEQVIPDPLLPLSVGSFGVNNAEDDLQQIDSYHVAYDGNPSSGEDVPADEMIHAKCNVDRVVKRGMPDFVYDVYDLIKIGGRLLENMAEGSAIQAAIAMVIQHETALSSEVQGFADAQAEFQQPNPMTGASTNNRRIQSGEVYEIPKGMTFAGAPYSQGLTLHTAVASMVMRCVGVKWNAPEWLISGDASNNNYSSSLTAESPFVKTAKRRQQFYGLRFLRLHHLAVRNKAEMGLLRARGQTFTWRDVQRYVEIDFTPATVETRDKHLEAETKKVELEAGVTSRQIWAGQIGNDWEQVAKDNEEYAAKTKAQQQPAGPPTGPGQSGAGPEKEPEQQGGQDAQEVSLSQMESELAEEVALTEGGFTGTITDSLGRKTKFEDGKRVTGQQAPKSPAQGQASAMLAGLSKEDRAAVMQKLLAAAPKGKIGLTQMKAIVQGHLDAKKPAPAGGPNPAGSLPKLPKQAEDLKTRMTSSLEKPDSRLSSEDRQEHAEATHQVLGRMPDAVIAHLTEHLQGVHYVADPEHLRDVVVELTRARKGDKEAERINNVLGEDSAAGLFADSRVYADGIDPEQHDTEGNYGEGAGKPAGILAHELTHVIDNGYQHSSSMEWRRAFAKEMKDQDRLTEYAGTSASEGFAEFGYLLYGSSISHATIEKEFPKASAYFKSRGLWPTEGSQEAPATARAQGGPLAPEHFSRRVQLPGGQENHADVPVEKTRKQTTESKDASGHEHDTKGRFGSGGGGGATAGKEAPDKNTATEPERAARGMELAKGVKAKLQAGCRALLDGLDKATAGSVSLITAGHPAQAAAQVFNSIFQCVHEEIFENALSDHSMSGAHAVASGASNLAARAHAGLIKGVAWAMSKMRGAPGKMMEEKEEDLLEPEELSPADQGLLNKMVHLAQQTLTGLYQEAGLKVAPPPPERPAGRLLKALRAGESTNVTEAEEPLQEAARKKDSDGGVKTPLGGQFAKGGGRVSAKLQAAHDKVKGAHDVAAGVHAAAAEHHAHVSREHAKSSPEVAAASAASDKAAERVQTAKAAHEAAKETAKVAGKAAREKVPIEANVRAAAQAHEAVSQAVATHTAAKEAHVKAKQDATAAGKAARARGHTAAQVQAAASAKEAVGQASAKVVAAKAAHGQAKKDATVAAREAKKKGPSEANLKALERSREAVGQAKEQHVAAKQAHGEAKLQHAAALGGHKVHTRMVTRAQAKLAAASGKLEKAKEKLDAHKEKLDAHTAGLSGGGQQVEEPASVKVSAEQEEADIAARVAALEKMPDSILRQHIDNLYAKEYGAGKQTVAQKREAHLHRMEAEDERHARYAKRVEQQVEADKQKDQVHAAIRQTAVSDGTPQIHGMPVPEHMVEIDHNGLKIRWPSGMDPDKDKFILSGIRGLKEAWKDLPPKLREAQTEIVHTTQANRDDAIWAQRYAHGREPSSAFVSAATGGDGKIVVYGGKGLSLGVFAHEAGHNLATQIWGSTTPAPNSDYGQAQAREPSVTEYGRNDPSEDFAEACRLYTDKTANPGTPVSAHDKLKAEFPQKYAALKAILGP